MTNKDRWMDVFHTCLYLWLVQIMELIIWKNVKTKMCSELGESGLRQAEASRCFGETKTLSDSVFKWQQVSTVY